MVHFDSTMIIVRRQGDDHLIQGYLHSAGNALVQLSRMVLEKGRLRRPERFLPLLRMVHFRRKCTMRNNCKRDVAEALPARDYCLTEGRQGSELWHIDILPMGKPRGLPPSRVGFTTSLDGSFTCAVAATSQSFLP